VEETGFKFVWDAVEKTLAVSVTETAATILLSIRTGEGSLGCGLKSAA
jgi:hypothetical protein